jgi:hypothetical protein
MKAPTVQGGWQRARRGRRQILSATPSTLLRLVLLGLVLLAAGCQGQPPPSTSKDSLQREADMLRKQNEEMVKKR